MSMTKDAAWTTCLDAISKWMQYILGGPYSLMDHVRLSYCYLTFDVTDMRSSSGSASRIGHHFERKLGTPLFGGISASNPLSTSSNSSVNQSEARLWHHLHKLSSTMQAFVIKVICKHQHMDQGIVTSIYSAPLPKRDDVEDDQQNKASRCLESWMSVLDVSTIVHFYWVHSETAATHLCNVDDETLSHGVGLHQETLVLNHSLLDMVYDDKEAVSTILSTCQSNQLASRIICIIGIETSVRNDDSNVNWILDRFNNNEHWDTHVEIGSKATTAS
ncbi:hypothetical protein LRAMOSA09084 [Lichtheimia ramosa]|uniref:Uncharacterized protein n=1 Tax=Lichtheimia ramosa TaxID=688394 RepID=A0A077WG16_9FUNG|nr:hypothetical protein LRAMOSA09084 [Lichtheimia ramosa]